MGPMAEYILSVVCASILCAILTGLTGEKGTTASIRKMVCGVFLCFTVIAPLGRLRLEDLLNPITDIRQEALETAAMGQALYRESLAQVITEQTEAYILDKAKALGLTLTVTVHTDESGKPRGAVLSGNAGQAQREALSEILESDLGIPKERQIWSES